MGFNGFTEWLFSALLGWMQLIYNWFWSMIATGGQNEFMPWFSDHWLTIAIAILLIGLAADYTIYLMRWQPYHIWLGALRRARGYVMKPFERERAGAPHYAGYRRVLEGYEGNADAAHVSADTHVWQPEADDAEPVQVYEATSQSGERPSISVNSMSRSRTAPMYGRPEIDRRQTYGAKSYDAHGAGERRSPFNGAYSGESAAPDRSHAHIEAAAGLSGGGAYADEREVMPASPLPPEINVIRADGQLPPADEANEGRADDCFAPESPFAPPKFARSAESKLPLYGRMYSRPVPAFMPPLSADEMRPQVKLPDIEPLSDAVSAAPVPPAVPTPLPAAAPEQSPQSTAPAQAARRRGKHSAPVVSAPVPPERAGNAPTSVAPTAPESAAAYEGDNAQPDAAPPKAAHVSVKPVARRDGAACAHRSIDVHRAVRQAPAMLDFDDEDFK